MAKKMGWGSLLSSFLFECLQPLDDYELHIDNEIQTHPTTIDSERKSRTMRESPPK